MNQQGNQTPNENPIDLSQSNEQPINSEENMVVDSEVDTEESVNPDNINSENKDDEWQLKFAEMNDRYLRLYSEFDNYRKRSARERVEFSKTAASDTFTAILPVLDDFDRAAKAMENADDIAVVKEGMQLIYHKFRNILISKGLEEMNAQGETFDADFHEAITSIPSPDDTMKGKVVDELEKGYSLNGKVIRFAKVVVGS
jgi:molecular chaperone GrpE